MLKALEIVGFKSFADRTRFEFPPGITVVVGPNGSGKSNIVDAIKWVLGEQSVKSLRGREMADVIFNGSGSRRALNAAEITLTFDNANHLLPLDTPEVHITRRVYRSGEGEYLINRNPARLRDIRDLLSGTGMGTQAYSVIEQGKVDGLLQSSPRDRRVIFEEAAGISRFKMRKIEALRRLEHVEQNLLRLSDIVDEVENRLRSVRTQAGKARRYKEHTDRLQELRTQVGQVDWKRLTERLTEFENQLQSLGDERDAATAEAENVDAQLLDIDHGLGAGQRGNPPGRIANRRQPRAHRRGRIDHRTRTAPRRRSRTGDRPLPPPTGRHERQGRRHPAAVARHDRRACKPPRTNHRDVAKRLVEAERGLTEVMTSLDQLRGENEQRRATYLQQMRLAASLGNETSALESQVAGASAVRQRCDERMAELDRTLDALQQQLDELRRCRERGDAAGRKRRPQSLLAAEERACPSFGSSTPRGRSELSEMRERRSGAAERAAVLDELVRRHEGLSAGVKEVLQRAANPADPVFRGVRGLVADLFHVSVEAAPLVEIALGQTAQHVVADPQPRTARAICKPSRTGSAAASASSGSMTQSGASLDCATTSSDPLTGRPGVLGRADRFVETPPEFAPLAERLLGRTWFVEKLAHAIALGRVRSARA